MNKYEITIITKEDTKGAPVKKEIEGLGGKVLSVNSLGQRQLIYPIKKETAGFYTVINFEIEPTKVLELNQKLGLKPEILRHLILVAKAIKIAAPKPADARATAGREKEIVIEKPEIKIPETKTEAKIEKVTEKQMPALPAGKPKPAKKIIAPKPEAPKVTKEVAKIEEEETSTEERLKALDKKLDELLKE